MKPFFGLQAFILATLLGACGKPPPFHVLERQEYQPLNVEYDDKIDILFVIDNSLSMENKQRLLSDAFASFISSFNSRKLDYQLGVISTENYVGELLEYPPRNLSLNQINFFRGSPLLVAGKMEASPYLGYKAFGPGGLISFGDNPRIIQANRNSSPESLKTAEKQFKENIHLCKISDPEVPGEIFHEKDSQGEKRPICISHNPEMGLRSILTFLNPQKYLQTDIPELPKELSSWNSGFLRKDARLAIIIVSDEDESLPLRPKGLGKSPYFTELLPQESKEENKSRIEKYLQEFVSEVKAAKENQVDRISMAVVVNLSQESIQRARQTNSKINPGALGSLYLKAADEFPIKDSSGKVLNNKLDISLKDFAKPLSELGESIAKSSDEFVVAQAYESLTVKIHIPSRGDNAWVDLKSNTEDGYFVRKHPTRKGAFIIKIGSKVPKEEGSQGYDIHWVPSKAAQ